MYQAFRDRLQVGGNNAGESLVNSTKRQATNLLLTSPTLSYITMGSNLEEMIEYPSIVSDKETFYERRFLFVPDTTTYLGDYIKHQDMFYLVVDKTYSDLYPQLFGELCNETMDFIVGQTKIRNGTDKFGKPMFETIDKIESLPCVMSTKIYSTADNNAIPLPDGAMTMRIPYLNDEKLIPKINQIINKKGSQFKVTTISYEKVLKIGTDEHGYLEVRLQREPTNLGDK